MITWYITCRKSSVNIAISPSGKALDFDSSIRRFESASAAKETCERKTTMIIIKTITSTLDVIFMLILFVSGRESKDKGTAIALWVLVMLLLLNMFLMWR